MESHNVWDRVLARAEAKVNRHSYYTWFHPSSLLSDTGELLRVRVPDPVFRDWLTKHYAGIIAEALSEVGRAGTRVEFVTDGPSGAMLTAQEAAPPIPPEEAALIEAVASEPAAGDELTAAGSSWAPPAPDATPGVGLNVRYTFESFVVGPSNQFAEAASRAVAEAPARSYNPLYIYGGVGLGKTHLMHAIGHYVLRHNQHFKLTYISTERFMNEMINAVKTDRVIDFRERYRGVDVLLVDDIQFLAGKEGTQNEFFHTFNALYDAQKQIVLSSDCAPNEIPSLEERLRSRFAWGLIADIQPPDLETKVAILKKKADAESVPLPDNVAIYIAEKIKSNIRELEGSLIRLIAFASLTGRDVSIDLAQEVLKNVIGQDDRAVTVDMIQKAVADYYQLKIADMRARNNSKSVALPRQIAMYLCKALTHASLPEIGRSFGGKHHSTVIHSIRKIEALRKRDRDFNSVINTLIDRMR
ncbi:MAG TPA: chromosomal replication initiator protein DnaA [Vicinamibacterales bacterium]|nr:chromosomal replication initiator protein DnaA [Vicinamibacterales bacterium]HOQ60792.1 chromosomal replication initiator protein DnaA [Vicinamibacterales bacterium]